MGWTACPHGPALSVRASFGAVYRESLPTIWSVACCGTWVMGCSAGAGQLARPAGGAEVVSSQLGGQRDGIRRRPGSGVAVVQSDGHLQSHLGEPAPLRQPPRRHVARPAAPDQWSLPTGRCALPTGGSPRPPRTYRPASWRRRRPACLPDHSLTQIGE